MTAHARGANGSAAVAAGSLILLALVGHSVADWLWLALVPAAALMVLAARDLHSWQAGRDGMLGVVSTLVLQGGSLLLLLLALANAITTTLLRLEPAWTATLDRWSAWVFLLGVILFGTAAAIAGVLPRGSAVAFAASIPLGFALDAVAERMAGSGLVTVIAPGALLSGVGFYVGLGIFAFSLIRLGLVARRFPGVIFDGGSRRTTRG
jgi:hypothetical protein